MRLGMPSLAVFNGHAYAGGLILGLMHDQRIMTEDPKKAVCLSEISVGFPLPVAYNSLLKATLSAKSFRELVLGAPWNAERALKGEVIDDIFSGQADCDAKIKAFAKKFAPVGAQRDGIKRNKEFYFKDAIHDLEYTTFSPPHLLEMTQGTMKAILEKNAKEAAQKKKRVAKL